MGARHARRQMVSDGRGTQEGRRQMQTNIVEECWPTGGSSVWGALAISAATAAHFALQDTLQQAGSVGTGTGWLAGWLCCCVGWVSSHASGCFICVAHCAIATEPLIITT